MKVIIYIFAAVLILCIAGFVGIGLIDPNITQTTLTKDIPFEPQAAAPVAAPAAEIAVPVENKSADMLSAPAQTLSE